MQVWIVGIKAQPFDLVLLATMDIVVAWANKVQLAAEPPLSWFSLWATPDFRFWSYAALGPAGGHPHRPSQAEN